MKILQQVILLAAAYFGICNLASAGDSLEAGITNNKGNISGDLRLGYFTSDISGDSPKEAAIGGNLAYLSSSWHSFSAGVALYTSQRISNGQAGNWFASDGDGYSLLGQAYVQAQLTENIIKLGRFEFDSPFADTDDIRMAPNNFSGLLVENTSIEGTQVVLAHLDKWAGVDSDKPEQFTELNGDNGITAVGVVSEAVENINWQAWYYYGDDFADFIYADMSYLLNSWELAVQLGKQSNRSSDNSTYDGEFIGLMAEYSVDDITIKTAYNNVFGMVGNGFGGGPFFTSAGDHTVGERLDQSAIAFGIEYAGIDDVTIGVLNVNFEQGADEVDLIVNYEPSDSLAIELVYHHMYKDGNFLLARFTVSY